VEVWAVLAREDAPPPGVTPIEWLLLTTVTVETPQDADERVSWYECRWVIEEYHRVLKSGCRAEDRQLKTLEGLRRCLSVDAIVAWRILFLTKAARACPDLPCTEVMREEEWQVLFVMTHPGTPLPPSPPSLREAVRGIAALGGFLGRKGDGEPGSITLWRGYRRLSDFLLARHQLHSLSPPTCG
jgi:hypothetical protein